MKKNKKDLMMNEHERIEKSECLTRRSLHGLISIWIKLKNLVGDIITLQHAKKAIMPNPVKHFLGI